MAQNDGDCFINDKLYGTVASIETTGIKKTENYYRVNFYYKINGLK